MNAVTPIRREAFQLSANLAIVSPDAELIALCATATAAVQRGVALCEGSEYEDDSPTDIMVGMCWTEYKRLESIVLGMPVHTLEGAFAKASMLSIWWKSGTVPDGCEVAAAIFSDMVRLGAGDVT
jgi:hypothetical protein